MHRGHQDPHISVSHRRHYIWASASSFSKCWISRSGGFESGVLRTTQEWADKGRPGQPLDWNKQLWFHKQQFDRIPKKNPKACQNLEKKTKLHSWTPLNTISNFNPRLFAVLGLRGGCELPRGGGSGTRGPFPPDPQSTGVTPKWIWK